MVNALDEQAQLAEVIERLTAGYPTLPQATIVAVVHDLHARFNGARLREYVPMLVERNARIALTELAVSYDAMPSMRAEG